MPSSGIELFTFSGGVLYTLQNGAILSKSHFPTSIILSSSSFSSTSDVVVDDELVEEGKRGEDGAPSRLEKEGVRSTLPAQDIIRRLPDSGEGDVRMRRLLTVAGAMVQPQTWKKYLVL